MKNLKLTDFKKLKGIQLKWKKNLYIDASHPNETRIVLKSDNSIEEYEFEDKNNLNFKNNIYLGTISRVEPSLQAAFVNFGREKHGFLAFNDIQSDYYQIPYEDKEKIKIAEEKIRENLKIKILRFPKKMLKRKKYQTQILKLKR